MKKFAFFITLTLIIGMLKAQTIEGDWSGKLSASGQEVQLIFHFSGSDEDLTATMDSPSQGASGIPVEKVNYEDGELSLSLMGGQITYIARVDGETMDGTFKQMGNEIPLKLSKGEIEKMMMQVWQNNPIQNIYRCRFLWLLKPLALPPCWAAKHYLVFQFHLWTVLMGSHFPSV
jgi:hypothetical protein